MNSKKNKLLFDIDTTIIALDDAITFLVKKRQEEAKKAEVDESHEGIANEIVVAVNSIKYLVSLLEDLRERTPLRGVDLRDESYETGKKVEEAGGKTFKDSKDKGKK